MDDASRRQLREAADAMAKATLTGFVALARHPSAEVRRSAIELLARRPEESAQTALVAALDEGDPEVCKTALSALWMGPSEDPRAGTLDAVIGLLSRSRSWSIRSRAAAALGRLAAKEPTRIDESLQKAALEDAFALVREAALRGLAKRGGSSLQSVLDRVAKTDAEPRLRELARKLKQPTVEKKP
jgi:HEAT repeat protein